MAVTEKFHEYFYGNKFLVCTDNNPQPYVLSSAKLDATGHRWLAALSTYNFTLKYKRGNSNGDADGLSRRPQEKIEVFPKAVKAICQAYTVSCPYVETVLVTDNPGIVETFDFNLESSDLSTVHWAKEQRNDPDINTVIQYVSSDYCPVTGKENSNISKYL